jgi:hypothetical protein
MPPGLLHCTDLPCSSCLETCHEEGHGPQHIRQVPMRWALLRQHNSSAAHFQQLCSAELLHLFPYGGGCRLCDACHGT